MLRNRSFPPCRLVSVVFESQRKSIEPLIDRLIKKEVFQDVTYGEKPEHFDSFIQSTLLEQQQQQQQHQNVNKKQQEFLEEGNPSSTTAPVVLLIGHPNAAQCLEYLFDKASPTFCPILCHSLWTGIDGMNAGNRLGKILNKPARPQNIPVSNARGTYSEMLAQHVLLSVLYFHRQVPRLIQNKENKIWQDRFSSKNLSSGNTTLTVCGYGDIGQTCAKRAVGGLGIQRVFGVRSAKAPEEFAKLSPEERRKPCSKVEGAQVLFANEIDEVLPQSDIVLSVLPNVPGTKNFFNAERFQKMKKDSIFINIGRGSTVDESALAAALSCSPSSSSSSSSSHLKGAACDVFATEPLPQESPLWSLPNDKFFLTPHNADIEPDMMEISCGYFAELAEKYIIDGEKPAYLVDLERGY